MADPLLVVLAAAVAAEAIAIFFLARAFDRHRREEARPAAAPRAASPPVPRTAAGNIEDIFLVHRSGLLLRHYTRRLRPNMDSDVLSGMLVAVQEFIKDSFRAEGGPLDEIRFGDYRIKLIQGQWTILAALVVGETTQEHTDQLRAALRDLEAQHKDLLPAWDGTMDQLPEVNRIMERLLEGGYRASVPVTASA